MKKSISKLLISALAVVTLSTFAMGCSSKDSDDKGKAETKKVEMEVLKTTSGTHELSVEKGKWSELTQPAPGAILKKYNKTNDQCLLVFEEPKSSFAKDITLKDYSNLLIQAFNKMHTNVKADTPKDIEINGKSASQFEISYTIPQGPIKALITVVPDDTNFTRTILFTTDKNFDKSRDSFISIANTFK